MQISKLKSAVFVAAIGLVGLLNQTSLAIQTEPAPRIKKFNPPTKSRVLREPMAQQSGSSFVPPSSPPPASMPSGAPTQSPPSSTQLPSAQSNGTQTDASQKDATFDPKGGFNPNAEFNPGGTSATFKDVSETPVKPLRSTTSPPATQENSGSFSLGDSPRISPAGGALSNASKSGAPGPAAGNRPTIPPNNTPPPSATPRIEPTAAAPSTMNSLSAGSQPTGNGSSSLVPQRDPVRSGQAPSVSLSPESVRAPESISQQLGSASTRSSNQSIQDSVQTVEKIQNAIEERIVDNDPTFDPQMKRLADSILSSLPRGKKNPVRLVDMVNGCRTPAERKKCVALYWNAFIDQADATFAKSELDELTRLPRTNVPLDQSLLRAAISSARARASETGLAVLKSHAQVARRIPEFDSNASASFGDLPWTGKYQTQAESFASSGQFAPKIRQVDSALRQVRDLSHFRAAAVSDNMQAIAEATLSYRNGQTSLATVLGLHRELRDQRIAFLTAVRDYNLAISDYAISVFPAASEPNVVASMLIDSRKTLSFDVISDPEVRQASGTQMPLQQ